MKIIYSQEFDKGYNKSYLKSSGPLFDTLILGPAGLLSLLERELNLSGCYYTSLERRIAYQVILNEYIGQNPGNLYERSFQYDPEGVAKELLYQRDQLILAGWSGEYNGVSKRLDFLAVIEQKYKVPSGNEDRWIKVLAELQNREGIHFNLSINLMEETGDMHPFFRKLFNLLEAHNCIVSCHEEEYNLNGQNNLNKIKSLLLKNPGKEGVLADLNENDHSFHILNFRTETEAAEFAAAQYTTLKDAAILNRNNNLFDETLNLFGYPVSGSEHSAAHASVIQLFRLISCILVKPVNIYNLMSYLQGNIHPLPDKLNYKLLRVLASTGGICNEEWMKVIEEYLFHLEDEDKKRKNERKIENFITFRDHASASIPVTDVTGLYSALKQWAIGLMQSDNADQFPPCTDQLSYLAEMCSSLEQALIKLAIPSIAYGELSNLIDGIYAPFKSLNYGQQAKSLDVIPLPGNLIGLCETIIWLDCYNEEMKPTWYSFLNNNEMESLLIKGIGLWPFHDQTLSRSSMLKMGILKATDQCILITVSKSDDAVTTDHPLVSFLKARVPELNKFMHNVILTDPAIYDMLGWPSPEIQEKEQTRLPEKKAVHEIKNGHLIAARQTESASSLEKMITYPFDWILHYPCGIEPANTYQLSDISITQGNVAHKFIELLLKDAGNDPKQATQLMNDYDKRLGSVVEHYGYQLMLEQHKFEYTSFHRRLKNAIISLISILDLNNLTIIGTEIEKTAALPVLNNQEIYGKIDLIVRSSDGSYGIIDLKWTRKVKKFLQILNDNRHLQLAVYKHLIQASDACKVRFVAYYSISEACLYTKYRLNGNSIVIVDNEMTEEQLLEAISHSIELRRQQFAGGFIEEGEEMVLEDLGYSAEGVNLYPLEEKNGLKKVNTYSNYAILKGEEI